MSSSIERLETPNVPGPAIGAISKMVADRDRALGLVIQALDLIEEAKKIAPPYSFENALGNKLSWYSDTQQRNKAAVRQALDRQCWRALLEKTKLGVVLNSKQVDQFHKQLEEEAPALTLECAMTTFADLYVNKEDSFREGVVECFRLLSRRYKSHDAFKVSKRVILRRSQGGFGDLWKYCCLLNGEDPTLLTGDQSPDYILDKASYNGQDQVIFPWFRVVLYQNGNKHIWFDQQPCLIDRINALIAEYYGDTLQQRKRNFNE